MAIALDTLVYARRLREAGFTERQAEGQAEALAAAMTDSLATKQDLREMELRMDARFAQVDSRFEHFDLRLAEFEKRMEIRLSEQEERTTIRFAEQEERTSLRFSEQTAFLRAEMADLERRMTMRLGGIMVTGIGVVSAVVKLL